MIRRSILTMVMILLICRCLGAEGKKWQEHRSHHFLIYYDNVPVDFVKNVEESAERYYDEITKDLGFARYESWSFDKRAKIYIFDNREEYIQMARQAGWSHGIAQIREKIIQTFPAAYGFFDTTLPHELGHIIFREFIGYETALPIWMDEGVAMFQEKAKRWGANEAVQKAIQDGRYIPLEELTRSKLYGSKDTNDVNLFYTEAASIVYFMINQLGEQKFLNFCRRLQNGEQFEWALKDSYGRIDNLKDLEQLWLRHLKE